MTACPALRSILTFMRGSPYTSLRATLLGLREGAPGPDGDPLLILLAICLSCWCSCLHVGLHLHGIPSYRVVALSAMSDTICARHRVHQLTGNPAGFA
jgi:hypothetical protein